MQTLHKNANFSHDVVLKNIPIPKLNIFMNTDPNQTILIGKLNKGHKFFFTKNSGDIYHRYRYIRHNLVFHKFKKVKKWGYDVKI